MTINYLSSISYAAGALTTLYGAYSYCKASKGNLKQRENAKLAMAIGVGLLAVGAGLSFYGNLNNTPDFLENTPDYLEPYVSQLKGRVIPQSPKSVEEFPSYLSKFPHPGLVATKEGYLCKIPDQLPPLEECGQLVKGVIEHVKKIAPDQYAEAMSDPWGKGYGVAFPDGEFLFEKVTFGMNKTIVSNYREALQQAEQTILKDSNFTNYSENVIVDSIKKIHECVTRNLKDMSGSINLPAGQFRKLGVIILDDATTLDKAGFEAFLRKNGGTKTDFANLKPILATLKKYADFDDAIKFLTPGEMITLRKIAFIPISSEKIAAAMTTFAIRFKEICSLVRSRLINPVAAGAWVLRQIGEIHPFEDANGRVSRILMNAVLQLGGLKGVVIPDDAAYTTALNADHKTVGTLAKYLWSVIEWNSRQTVLAS